MLTLTFKQVMNFIIVKCKRMKKCSISFDLIFGFLFLLDRVSRVFALRPSSPLDFQADAVSVAYTTFTEQRTTRKARHITHTTKHRYTTLQYKTVWLKSPSHFETIKNIRVINVFWFIYFCLPGIVNFEPVSRIHLSDWNIFFTLNPFRINHNRIWHIDLEVVP